MNQEKRGLSTTAIILIVVIIAGASIGASAYVLTRPQPDFQVRELSVSSEKVAKGDIVTAQVEVTNTGDAEGTHTVKLEIENETLKKKVTLGPGESRTVSFDIERQEKGTYSLNIEGLSESFEVVEPAGFELSNLQVSPKEAEPREVVTISLDVKNVGGKEGSRTVELNLNSSIEKTRDVTLAPGESTSITFTVQKETGKSYSVKVGNLSGSFEVLPPSKPTKLRVRIEVDGRILHYNEIRAWEKSRFNSIMENRAGFESSQIERFNEIYKVNADNFKVKSQEENNSTVFKCDVQDKISTSGDRRTATFLWFLNPLGLDFIEDNFDESKTGLSWRGKINGTQTIITIDLPAQDSVYEDWGESVGHCHGHVWWPIQVPRPAEFELSNLLVNPSKVSSGEPVNVSVDVHNVGEASGEYTVELKVNTNIEKSQTVSLEGGEKKTVSFTIQRETKKSYSVSIGDLTSGFEVVEPAEFEVSNLQVTPSQVELGETVSISVDLKNTGDLSGDYTVELEIDGTVEKTQDVNLSEGETTKISFTLQKETEKTYSVKIGGLSKSFEVAKIYTKPSSSELGGNITEDTLLTTSKSPYIVTETVQVLENVTLKIEPGVIIKFDKDTGLNVGGELIARGTEDEKITFTSNQANPSPGDWTGIRFVNSAKDAEFDSNGSYVNGSIISFSTLEYGGKAPEGSYDGGVLNCKRANPFISNNLIVKNFSQSYGGGIFIRDGEGIKMLNNEIKNNESGDQGGGFWIISSDIVIENNRIQGNSAGRGGGLYVAYSAGAIEGNKIISNSASSKGGGIFFRDVGTGYPKQKINRNNFKNNTDYAIYRDPSYPGSADIDAAHNYWGTTDKSEIEDKIYDYYDDISLGKVIFKPIATEPF